jgi:hypothetical protein
LGKLTNYPKEPTWEMKLYFCIKTLLQSTALSPDSLEPPKAFAHEKKRERNEYSGVSEEPTKVKEMK